MVFLRGFSRSVTSCRSNSPAPVFSASLIPFTVVVKLPLTSRYRAAFEGFASTSTSTRKMATCRPDTAKASCPGSQIQRMADQSPSSSGSFQEIHFALQSDFASSPILAGAQHAFAFQSARKDLDRLRPRRTIQRLVFVRLDLAGLRLAFQIFAGAVV